MPLGKLQCKASQSFLTYLFFLRVHVLSHVVYEANTLVEVAVVNVNVGVLVRPNLSFRKVGGVLTKDI